jgi:8-oxo-dGTP diphosphatase
MQTSLHHRIACALLIRDERVFLAHRSLTKRWYPNVWDLPGGHIKQHETPVEAVVREVREELGVDIEAPGDGPLLHVRLPTMEMWIWRVDEWTGEVTNAAPEEHDAIGWFTLAETQQLPLASESYLELLQRQLS